MKHFAKVGFYASMGVLLTGVSWVNAAIQFWEDQVDSRLKGTENSADSAIQTIVGNFMVFLWIIALWIFLWWGFNILTAAGDEEKVKKWKTILLQAGLWMLVIFLANSLLQWLLGLFTGA